MKIVNKIKYDCMDKAHLKYAKHISDKVWTSAVYSFVDPIQRNIMDNVWFHIWTVNENEDFKT